jgi:hypothetical protein
MSGLRVFGSDRSVKGKSPFGDLQVDASFMAKLKEALKYEIAAHRGG